MLTKNLKYNKLFSMETNNKKNKKWPKFWALFLDSDINEKAQTVQSLSELLKKRITVFNEAIRLDLKCFYSRRNKRWVFFKDQQWTLSPELNTLGLNISKVGNREADYTVILDNFNKKG